MNAKLKTILKATGLLNTWLNYKQRPYIQQNEVTAKLWQKKIASYQAGEISPTPLAPKRADLVGRKVIWQYWGQGIDNTLPELIKICFASVDKYKGDYEIIRISNDTISEYIEFPPVVQERLQQGNGYTLTFFSDLLRVALLATYGGVWLDATIYFTGELPKHAIQGDFFIYQRDSNEPISTQQYYRSSYYPYWGWASVFRVRTLNAFIISKPQHPLVWSIYTLLLNYWHTEDKVEDYFFFQVLYNELIEGLHKDDNCPIVSDCLPHLLASSICDPHFYSTTEEVLQMTSVHKLNGKGEDLPKTLNYLKNLAR